MPIPIICEQCKATFHVDPYRKATARFCSRHCKAVALAGNLPNDVPHTWSLGNKHREGLRPANAYAKGQEPWNKGTKGIRCSPGSEFKVGHKRNHAPLGTVRILPDKKGKMRAMVNVAEPNRWRARATLEWEKVNGPLPRGKVVHHTDRHTLNDAIDNLRALTRAEHLNEHRAEHQRAAP